MFNKKTYTIFIVLFILLIGLSVAAATDNNTDTKTTKTTDTHKNTAKTTDNTVKSSDTTKHVKTDKTTETTKSNKTVTSNITKTERSSNTKSSPDLQPISISTNDVNCNYGDIVKLNVTTDPSGVTDGIITWFIDDDPFEVRNLATTDGSCNLDTSDYDLGVHEIMVDFGVSTTYDNANAYATLTINHTITVTSDNTDLNYNISDNSGDTITLSSADNYARGNINVYVNNVLAKSYSNVNYDDYTITFDDTIMDGQSAGIVPFKLEFIPRNTYVKANNITGTVFVPDTTTLSSSTTDLVNAAFIDESIVHNTVNIASTNTMAHGDIELYINDTYNRTYTDVNWNNYNLAFDTGVGNYTWKLIFKDNRGYIATNNLTGTLRALPHLLLSVDDIECTIGDVVNVPVTILPDVHEGILTWYVDGRVCAVRDLSESSATYSLRTSYFLPGTYELMVTYGASENYANTYTTSNLLIHNLTATFYVTGASFTEDKIKINLYLDPNGMDPCGYIRVYNGSTQVTYKDLDEEDDLSEIFVLILREYNFETLNIVWAEDDGSNIAARIFDEANITYTVALEESVITSADKTELVGLSRIDGASNYVIDSVLISSSNTRAHGDVLLYIDNVLNTTYTDAAWNGMRVNFTEKIGVGNHNWKLVFQNNGGYSTSDISGTIRLLERIELGVEPIG